MTPDDAVDGYECGDCGALFVNAADARDHADRHDHETYAVYLDLEEK